MKKNIILLFCLMLAMGCARVKVEAPKEPIKVDVTMRLDIYQHIEKDINQIEDMISGPAETKPSSDNRGLLGFFITPAYAQEGLSPKVEEAAMRRKERRGEIVSWQAKGILGENKVALLEIRQTADPSVKALVNAENDDRMTIYKEVADKNGSAVAEVQKMYAKRLQSDAPSGTPIEVFNAASGQYEWQIKP